MRRAGATIFAMVMLAAGCRERKAAAAPAETSGKGAVVATTHETPSSAEADKSFEDAQHHFATVYPATWTTRKDDANVLCASNNSAELDIAVPKLPAHIPGIIPLPAVQNGYVDDVRKRLKNVKTTSGEPIRVAGATARKFGISGVDDSGKTKNLLVIAIVKGDHLYIVTGEAPADSFDAARDAVERVAASWKWIK